MSSAEKSLAIKADTVDLVASKVRKFLEDGELRLPPNYSPENALKSAWLVLQSAETSDRKPVLEVCTRASVANALLDMVVQALSPAKKQCYFIPYGQTLTCQRSYHGTMAVAEMVDPGIEDIVAEVVYEGDVLTYHIERGQKVIDEHRQTIENVDAGKIKAAYAIVVYRDGRLRTTIMTFDEIKQSWRQSRMNPFDDKGQIKAASTHGRFTAEMCKRTVISRACKPIINSSNDSYLFQQAVHRTEDITTDVEIAEEIAEQANRETIDVQPEVVSDESASPSERSPGDLFEDGTDHAEDSAAAAAGAPF